ncbi:hypothetical protein ANCCAN_18245 [Ancylostoma caninum]|uniref:Uncharacterized protein n=1 Tax=Ancylostoma caninum TaxID=29170 RepID=A0A368FUJ1_ANCCA|nr:hypothetical protein ANCCAN_18245 [Ancylostoma caninum]
MGSSASHVIEPQTTVLCRVHSSSHVARSVSTR